MAVKPVITIGDPLLRSVSRPVTRFDLRLHLLLRDMAETMYEKDGVGLAAPQIGIRRRIAVIDAGEGLMEFINPRILEPQGSAALVEGCLSVPGRRGQVTRPERLRVLAQDRDGKPFEMEAEGLLARALQHEVDHLDGILFIDRMDFEVFDDPPEDEAEAGDGPDREGPG